MQDSLRQQNMTYDGVDIGEAVQPIQDRVETFQSNGYAVINPGDALSAGAYAVTVNSGNLDASDTLSVGSSNDEIIFDGSTKSLSSATNIRINSVSAAGDGTEQYRYDVIYADSSGEVQKTEGSVTKLDSRESQNNLTRFERFRAAIPNPGTDPSVIIAAVIVNSNDSIVGTGQLRDYRVCATHKVSALEADGVVIGDDYHYAGYYGGSDVDARLDNALAAATDGDAIYLESGSYTDNRTISKEISFRGSTTNTNGASIEGNWTLDANHSSIKDCIIINATINANKFGNRIINCNLSGSTINIDDDEGVYMGLRDGSITLKSNTEFNIVDSSARTTVTDNGSNTVGDKA